MSEEPEVDIDLSELSLVDERVSVYLTSGQEIRLHQMDSTKIVKMLGTYGYATMVDEKGRRVTLFLSGISAIMAGTDDE